MTTQGSTTATPQDIQLEFYNFDNDPARQAATGAPNLDLPSQLYDAHDLSIGGPIAGGPMPGAAAASSSSVLPGAPAGSDASYTTSTSRAFWTIEFYYPYFNVSTEQVGKRILHSWGFFRPDFLPMIESSPDLYGPFWILTTTIVVLAITSNIGSYFSWNSFINSINSGTDANPFKTEWSNDFTKVSIGTLLVYLYSIFAPVVLWLVMKWQQIPVSLISTVALYGYSFAIVLPFLLLCVITFEWFRWIAVLLAFILASVFIFLNLFTVWNKSIAGPYRLYFLLGLGAYVFILHLTLALIVKLVFYSFWISSFMK